MNEVSSSSNHTNIPVLLAVITVIICIGILWLYFKYGKSKYAKNNLPGLFTFIGIAGTFLGVSIGLFGFNPSNIDTSIPVLLSGLRTAFFTSIFGMILALILRVRSFIENNKISKENEASGISTDEEANMNTLADGLARINKTIENMWAKADRKIEGIEKALVGDGDTTLLTQMQKMRTSFSDKQDELISEFKEFARNMAENNSKALIEALESVIEDFNTKINEQFGENFKQLNIAVGKILEWQEQYRIQMKEMLEQFERNTKAIAAIEESLAAIVEDSSNIFSISETIEPIVIALDEKQKDLEKNLRAFAAMSEKANSFIPQLNEHIKEVSDGYVKMLESASTNITKSVEFNMESIKSQTELLEKSGKEYTSHIDQALSAVGDTLEKITREHASAFSNQVKVLDEALSTELQNALKSLGNQLATLSSKFASDYLPLTESLKEVVEIAKGLK